MSAAQGATFTRVDGDKVNGGGPFANYEMIARPEGGERAVFNMNHKPGPRANCGNTRGEQARWALNRQRWKIRAYPGGRGAIMRFAANCAGSGLPDRQQKR
jgi:hypothetical protein